MYLIQLYLNIYQLFTEVEVASSVIYRGREAAR